MQNQSAYTLDECRNTTWAYLQIVRTALNYSKEKHEITRKDLELACENFVKTVPLNIPHPLGVVHQLDFLKKDVLEVIADSIKKSEKVK